MQAVCDILEQLVREGLLKRYAIALTVGRPKDRARLVYLVELPVFDRQRFANILARHSLQKRWHEWAAALGLNP
ncbi:MAG: hypothetical protein ACO3JG_10445 [Luteolibacter sp.]